MSFSLLPVRRKLYLGFYCTSLVTGLVLLCLFSVLRVETEFDRLRRNSFFRKEYLPLKVNLPTTFIYKQGHQKIMKREENTIIYKNTIEEEILNLSWVSELHQILIKTNKTKSLSPQINLVVADKKCMELLLNWLIAALVRLSEPLRNIVVLGLDWQVCDLMKPRNIYCVYSNPKSFMRNSSSRDSRFMSVYAAPQTRLLAVRLISYWGFSFASYDTDALVLRNPQALYDRYREMDIVAGASLYWPQWAGERWGFSMCLGAFMMRSGPATERLWKVVSKTWGQWGSEQDQFNRALANTITWNHTHPNITSSQFCQHRYAREGFTKKMPRLHVLLLPPSQICRGHCCDDDPLSHDLYISHAGGGNTGRFSSKITHMKQLGVWFLRDDWREVSTFSYKTQQHWLKQISTL